jgi:hypothetical protein
MNQGMIPYLVTACDCFFPTIKLPLDGARDNKESGLDVVLVKQVSANDHLAFSRIIES